LRWPHGSWSQFSFGEPRNVTLTTATRTVSPTIPVYPWAQNFTTARSTRHDGSVDQTLTFETDDSLAQVFDYYRATLASAGWQDLGGNRLENNEACPVYLLYFYHTEGSRRYDIQLVPERCR
jgi:hypothetical protein